MKICKSGKRKISTRLHSGDLAAPGRRKLRQQRLEEMAASEEDQKRFWNQVKKGKADDCWEWLGCRVRGGYGAICKQKQGIRIAEGAHRVSYFLKFGLYAGDLCVCHKCDNPICVNPRHLFIGTIADNNHDKIRKHRDPRGETHGRAKLTEKQVLWIRQARKETGLPYQTFGDIFGMSKVAIRFVIIRRNWKHVK